jgi:transposase
MRPAVSRLWLVGIITLTNIPIWSCAVASVRPIQDKPAALQETGTLNPRPQAVTDEVFASSGFFDPRDLVQVKYEMVRRVQTEGESVTRAAAAFGFSRQTFYQTQAALSQEGLPGLVPRRRGPRGPHKLRPEVLSFLEEIRGQEPALRPRELAERVRENFGVSLHPRTIERALGQGQKGGRATTN